MSYEKTSIVTGAEQSVGEGLIAGFLKSACDVVEICLAAPASLCASSRLVLRDAYCLAELVLRAASWERIWAARTRSLGSLANAGLGPAGTKQALATKCAAPPTRFRK